MVMELENLLMFQNNKIIILDYFSADGNLLFLFQIVVKHHTEMMKFQMVKFILFMTKFQQCIFALVIGTQIYIFMQQ